MNNYENLFDDNKYLERSQLKNEVVEILKNLELDRHRLRIQMVINNMSSDTKLSSGSTIGEALAMLSGRISRLETTFHYLLEDKIEKL